MCLALIFSISCAEIISLFTIKFLVPILHNLGVTLIAAMQGEYVANCVGLYTCVFPLLSGIDIPYAHMCTLVVMFWDSCAS